MKQFKKNGVFLAVLFGILSIVMLFLANALQSVDKILNMTHQLEATGFETIFGKKNSYEFNLYGFLAVLFTVLGAILAFLPVLPAKMRFILSAILMIVGGVLFFVYPGTIEIPLLTVKPAMPIILSGIFAILGGITNVGLVLANK